MQYKVHHFSKINNYHKKNSNNNTNNMKNKNKRNNSNNNRNNKKNKKNRNKRNNKNNKTNKNNKNKDRTFFLHKSFLFFFYFEHLCNFIFWNRFLFLSQIFLFLIHIFFNKKKLNYQKERSMKESIRMAFLKG